MQCRIVYRWRAACPFLHCRGAAPRLMFNFGLCIQVCAAINDFDIAEASSQQTGAVVVDMDCSSDAADIGSHASRNCLRQLALKSATAACAIHVCNRARIPLAFLRSTASPASHNLLATAACRSSALGSSAHSVRSNSLPHSLPFLLKQPSASDMKAAEGMH